MGETFLTQRAIEAMTSNSNHARAALDVAEDPKPVTQWGQWVIVTRKGVRNGSIRKGTTGIALGHPDGDVTRVYVVTKHHHVAGNWPMTYWEAK